LHLQTGNHRQLQASFRSQHQELREGSVEIGKGTEAQAETEGSDIELRQGQETKHCASLLHLTRKTETDPGDQGG
jgi:hypothetical protein